MISKKYKLIELHKWEWVIVLSGFIALIFVIQFFGGIYALVALAVLICLDLIFPVIQITLWSLASFGLLSKKIPCPHCCAKDSSNLTKDV